MTRIYLAGHDLYDVVCINRGVTYTQSEPIRPRLLFSFYYLQDTDLDVLLAKCFTPPYPDVFFDSGAFSATTRGTTIDRTTYIAYIKRFQHLFTSYANLDVIGNPAQTLENQHALEAEGLTPIPVFHVGEPWSVLEFYLDAGYPYIALGGIAGETAQWNETLRMHWLVQCFRRAQHRSVFHGLGMTAYSTLRALPWYSVDSSSWGSSYRYGQLSLFDPRAGVFARIQLFDHASCYRYAPLIRAYGYDPRDFAQRSRYTRTAAAGISALSYVACEHWLRRRHGIITIPTRDRAPVGSGLRVYLADGSFANFHDGYHAVHTHGLKIYLADASMCNLESAYHVISSP